MFCKIEFIPKQAVNDDEAKELIWMFLCSLERNGQILKDYKLIRDNNFTVYLTLPKGDSFDEKHDGIYVKLDRMKINELFECRMMPLGENMQSQAYCQCKNHSAIEMQTYYLDIDSAFTCCDCGKPIALYELALPAEDQEDYCAVQNWQENYSSMDMLWMHCLCDRYTGNQRVSIDSALNKQGYEIAEYMSAESGVPVYYHLECDYGRKTQAERVGDEQIHICPKCGKLMKRVCFSENHTRDICESCRLSYDAH